MKNPIIVISGPTASGKSSLALKIAREYDGIIINADSMQVYKEIPIITAQPIEEMKLAPHLLYGALSAKEICSVGVYLDLAKAAINEARDKGKLPIIVGGTGLYLKSLIYGMAEIEEIDPEIRENSRKTYDEMGAVNFYQMLIAKDPLSELLNILDKQRVLRAYEVFMQTGLSITKLQKTNHSLFSVEDFVQIGLIPERAKLYDKINQRFRMMIDEGMVDEIRNLNSVTIDENHPARKAIGVREINSYLNGQISLDEAITKAQQLSRNYAKRQITWIKHQMPDMLKLAYDDIDDVMLKCFKLIEKL
ncbi:tRNA dimethylallyltransferase [Candidatus Arcanobacter lacustris]|uniref:tRNA dimethylallyltransferase n=1 Tax=Candidatus Arcanibacter lacustris TaxID=1607817 RepID=A0A0F5MPM1_9RICK|nr:tRNA dimethylallyltransferase [Candidatus Arcanobacter lacustris]